MLAVALCVVLPLGINGCATQSTTTGIVMNAPRHSLPVGMPRRVAVIFSGQAPIDMQSADQFSSALIGLGFDVVERNHIDQLLKEQELSTGGRLSAETAARLGRLIGAEGIFVGTVTGESSLTWLDTHLSVNLVNTETGKIVWGADVHDPRTFGVSMDVKTSIVYTTRHAIKLLKRDLEAIKK